MAFTFLYVTAKDGPEARKIAQHLLEKRLAACANIFPIKSLYRREGKIREDKEAVLILKTAKKNSKKARKEVEKIHSYNIPCITEIDVRPNEKYAGWLQNQLA